MRRFALIVAGVSAVTLAIAPVQLHAQPAKAPVQVDKATMERAAFNLKLLISAMQSEKVPPPIKNALFLCIYGNSIGKIGEAMEKAIAANKGRIDRKNPDQMLGVMAGICGYRPATPAAAPKK